MKYLFILLLFVACKSSDIPVKADQQYLSFITTKAICTSKDYISDVYIISNQIGIRMSNDKKFVNYPLTDVFIYPNRIIYTGKFTYKDKGYHIKVEQTEQYLTIQFSTTDIDKALCMCTYELNSS